MREWINRQVKGGQYANASDYIRNLIRHDQRQVKGSPISRLLNESILFMCRVKTIKPFRNTEKFIQSYKNKELTTENTEGHGNG